jgi:hypothetical protein
MGNAIRAVPKVGGVYLVGGRLIVAFSSEMSAFTSLYILKAIGCTASKRTGPARRIPRNSHHKATCGRSSTRFFITPNSISSTPHRARMSFISSPSSLRRSAPSWASSGRKRPTTCTAPTHIQKPSRPHSMRPTSQSSKKKCSKNWRSRPPLPAHNLQPPLSRRFASAFS